MSLNGADIHVACRHTTGMNQDAIAAAEASLSAQELNRRNQFRLAEDRRDYTAAHDLLRQTLSQIAGLQPNEWNFAVGPHGKPSLAPASNGTRSGPGGPPIGSLHEISFSLSHTRGLVACAVAIGKDVGVDVERIDRDLEVDNLAERFFSNDEVTALRRYRGEARKVAFIELWTLKEAFVKATGRGLSQSLSAFSIDIEQESPVLIDPSAVDKGMFWRFALFAPSPLTRMAVAVSSASAEEVRFDARSQKRHVPRITRRSPHENSPCGPVPAGGLQESRASER